MGLLGDLGYTDVSHYPGGLTEWHASTELGIQNSEFRIRARIPKSRFHIPHSTSTRLLDALADRTVGALFRLWIEIVVGCALAYWALAAVSPRFALLSNGVPIAAGVRGLLPAIYFSAVTATSIGYGDIVPAGAARVLAVGEGIAGLILFGCVVSKFVSRRQDQVIGEIHRIAFEDRLGRVRTNLLLVRSELRATARLCEGREIPPPEAVARVEGAAMVFVGELRAVHDLLYRPQETPDEPVLEAILAGLTTVFREFNELLSCIHAQGAARPAALAASVKDAARLAREICGDCVPREFAPALRTWMDQIQRMAADVEQI